MAREQGVAVLWARGHELERAFGWGVARSLFEASLGPNHYEELLAGPARQARVLFDAGEGVAGGDLSEAGFAIYLAGRPSDQPIAVAVGARAGEPSRDVPIDVKRVVGFVRSGRRRN